MDDFTTGFNQPNQTEQPKPQNSFDSALSSNGYSQNTNNYNDPSSCYGQSTNSYNQPSNSYGQTSSAYGQNQSNGYYDSPTAGVYSSADVYEMGKNFSNYGVTTDSMLVATLKAIGGAVVGAIPGLLLWILIGKVGVVAALCGSLLAVGVIAGYTFMTKDDYPQKYGLIICVAVIVLGIYFADKVVWCWELSEQFQSIIGAAKNEAYELGDSSGLSKSELDAIIDPMIKAEFGITKGTFGDFFFNFGKFLKACDSTGRYIFDLVLSYLLAFVGGASYLKKFGKR